MFSSMKPAEMANSANYAAMSYGELLNTKNAYTFAVGVHINPLLKTKRLEEMVKITRIYLTAMNAYDATKDEIQSCLEDVGMNENHMFSFHNNLDDKTPPVNVDPCQAVSEMVLALPEHSENNMGDIDVNAYWDALAGGTTQGEEEDSESSSSEGEPHLGMPEVRCSVNDQTETESSDDNASGGTESTESEETTIVETKGNTIVEEAIEMMKTFSAPKDVDVNAPYYVEADYAYGDTAKPGYSYPTWRNMGRKDLEDFREASENYYKLFRKMEVLVSTDDYLVINESQNSIRVRRYYFPELSYNEISSNVEDSYVISDTERKEMKKKESLLKKAIKKAKEISSTMGMPADTPFYDRFTIKKDGKELVLQGDPKRFFEDAEALPVIMSSFETYARLFNGNYQVFAKDNCVAATTRGETFYVVLFNIPVTKNERKARRKSELDTESVAELERKAAETSSSSAQNVRDSILKAVEMTKSLPINDGTDNDAPYFVQRDFIITGSGDVVPKDRPFSQNVKDDNEFNGFRNKHRKFAKTMKARQCVSTDKYTAFIGNDGKTLTVYYYNQNAQG